MRRREEGEEVWRQEQVWETLQGLQSLRKGEAFFSCTGSDDFDLRSL